MRSSAAVFYCRACTASPRRRNGRVSAITRPPSDGFTIVIAAPFVVIGDDQPADVRRRAKNTVEWAVERLKAAYFEKDPADILDVWLFKNKSSYQQNAEKLFGEKPDTPYGYFSAEHRALVMNIATGGGTLVHEIVHPFVAANFPKCPSWFNEGLGSLYEQAGEEDGEIHGYTNWRLPGLQEAIQKKRVPSFRTLCSTTTNEFYEKRRIVGRTTPRRDTSATTCSNRACCKSITAASTRIKEKTRRATRRCKKF